MCYQIHKLPHLISHILVFIVICACGGPGDTEQQQVDNPSDETSLISLNADPESIPGDGKSFSTINAALYEKSGEPVAKGKTVSFSTTSGMFSNGTDTISIITTNDSGQASVALRAAASAGMAEVSCVSDDVRQSTQVYFTISENEPELIMLTIDPSIIAVKGSTIVTAEVLDEKGAFVADGTTVNFRVDDEIYGNFEDLSSVTYNGKASSVFTAGVKSGSTAIEVTSDPVSQAGNIRITSLPAHSIEFVSAEPDILHIKGVGGLDQSIVSFIVKDIYGNGIGNVNVSMKMYGPGGGEVIDPSNKGEEIDVFTDKDGIARITLYSGNIAGSVSITASIESEQTTISAETSGISIGGGVPAADRLDIASDALVLSGLKKVGETANLTVLMADRFGNYNILKGSTVNFSSESGVAINSQSVTLNDDGIANVIVRTQQTPEDVEPVDWEVFLQQHFNDTYNYSTIGHPRDGWCSILVYTIGEERFDDSNANGVYDQYIDTFYDSDTDPFLDCNDNDTYDGPGSVDSRELYIDSPGGVDGEWNNTNGKWDGDKYIFENFRLLMTGTPIVAFDSHEFNVQNGSSDIVKIAVFDQNLNPLSDSTKVTITCDTGKTVISKKPVYPVMKPFAGNLVQHLDNIEFIVEIHDAEDDAPPDDEPKEAAILNVKVEWEGIESEYQLSGFVD